MQNNTSKRRNVLYRGRIDMERCLETNIVCSNCNKLCKDCKLDECKQTIKMIDRLEEKEYDFKIKKIKAQLPQMCKECSLLQILNLDKQLVYCPYRINNRCLIKRGEKNE